MRESRFQSELIKELKERFPGCIIMKNDPNYIQGIPDLIILFGSKWRSLECKRDGKRKRQPNQTYYVDLMNKMSYSAFIFPENKEDILDELSKAFRT